MKHYKNIQEAMKDKRDCDIVTKVLSNKFCLALSAIESNGVKSFESLPTIFGLAGDGTIYTYGRESDFKRLYFNYILKIPSIARASVAGRAYFADNRKYLKAHRKLAALLLS